MFKLNDAVDINNARNTFKHSFDMQKKKVLICGGTGCVAGGSLKIYAEIIRLLEIAGVEVSVELKAETEIVKM